MRFSELVAAIRAEGGGFSVAIPEGWTQGRTTYGGLSAALCLEAARRAVPDLPPLRSAQIAFIGPAGGAVAMTPSLLRRGKSTVFVGVDLSGAQGLATRAILAFGAGRDSRFDRSFLARADVPGPDGLEPYIPEGFGPVFAQHFETRLVKGARPVTASKEYDHWLWIRHRDPAARDIVALVALADMPPPAVFPMFDAPAPISSINWTLNLLAAAPATQDGWWLLRTRAENAAEGYSSQDMTVWNRDGAPVVAARQSVALFL